jgi:Flp pilus assembly pilin Flp
MKNSSAPLKDEKGQGLVEYSIILLLVAAAVFVALSAMGVEVAAFFTSVTGMFPS